MKNEITIHSVLDWIAQEKYELAQNGLRTLVALDPNKDRLYSLYHYCTQWVLEIPDGFLVEPVRKKTLSPWRKCLGEACQYANQGEYMRAIELLKQSQEKLVAQNGPLPSYPVQPLERKLRAAFQNQALLLLHQAKCLYLSGNKTAAKLMYQKCLQSRFQGGRLSVRDSIEILLKLKQPKFALEYLQQMAEQAEPEYLFDLDELRAEIYLVLGQSEQVQKAVQQAGSYYAQKIQRFALDDNAYADFAQFLINSARYYEALLANAKAIALCPDCYDYYLTRAYIYAQLKDKVQAYEALYKAKQIGSPTQQRHAALERGKIYELLGEYERAVTEYQEEKERPGLRRDHLVALYQKTGQPEKIQAVEQELRQRAEFDERVSEEMLAELLG